MREIKFRGKNEYDKWKYGTGLIQYKTGEIGILNNFSKYGREATEMLNRTNVIPKTLGQYIGLDDKNGKKIFSGDIIKVFADGRDTYSRDINEIGTVVYNTCAFEYEVQRDGYTATYSLIELLRNVGDDAEIEVIGNIYDNPELLKED